jgi:copper transport protein
VLPAARTLPANERVQFLAPAIVRFSGLAVTAVAVLVVTGVYRALAEISGPGDLVSTAYGRVLLVKLVLFGVMLAVGGYNRLVLHPRLERAALGLAAGDRGAGAALRVSIRAELALAAAVLLSVAVLVAFPPPA